MLPRKSDKLKQAVSNWIEDIEMLEVNFKRKSTLVIEYINRIGDINKSNMAEKIFLMQGLEDTIYVLKNDIFDKFDFILGDILGNELEENKEINVMFNQLKDFLASLEELYISIRNLLKTYNLTDNKKEILSNIITDIKDKLSKYTNNISQHNELFSKVIKYLKTQHDISQKYNI